MIIKKNEIHYEIMKRLSMKEDRTQLPDILYFVVSKFYRIIHSVHQTEEEANKMLEQLNGNNYTIKFY